MGGSINYHRKVLFMLDGLRFVILRSFLGTICLFVQSYSSLYSFTHKQIDHQKQPRKLTKLIYRNAHISFQHIDTRVYAVNFSVYLHQYLLLFLVCRHKYYRIVTKNKYLCKLLKILRLMFFNVAV